MGGRDLPGPGADSTWTGCEPAEPRAGGSVPPARPWLLPPSPPHGSPPRPASPAPALPPRQDPRSRTNRSPQQLALTPSGPRPSLRLTPPPVCLENRSHTQTCTPHWPCAGLRAKPSSCFVLLVPVSSGGGGRRLCSPHSAEEKTEAQRGAETGSGHPCWPGPQGGGPRWPGPHPCSGQQMAPVPTGPSGGQARVERGSTWRDGRLGCSVQWGAGGGARAPFPRPCGLGQPSFWRC